MVTSMPPEPSTTCANCAGALPSPDELGASFDGNTLCPACAAELERNADGGLEQSPGEPDAHNAEKVAAKRDLGIRISLFSPLLWAVSFEFEMLVALAAALAMYRYNFFWGRGDHPLSYYLRLPFAQEFCYALLAPFVFVAGLRWPIERHNWPKRSLLFFLGGLAFSVVHVAIRGLLSPVYDPRTQTYFHAIYNAHTHTFELHWLAFQVLFAFNIVDDLVSVYVPILVIAHAVCYYKSWRERELRASQLEAQLSKAYLRSLKSQLQPHFLFNTLHSISSLMHSDLGAAEKMIARLSELLRMSLEDGAAQTTTLSRELEFVTAYLDIEKVRFSDRMKVTFDIAPGTLDAEVPHLMLQPLVENAVKHGVARRTAGGEIAISATRDEGRLLIRVRDNGPDLNGASGGMAPTGGVGLRATRERLDRLYGTNQQFSLAALPDGGVEARVTLPFRSEARP
jgi:two-component system LytT family sensor kinase